MYPTPGGERDKEESQGQSSDGSSNLIMAAGRALHNEKRTQQHAPVLHARRQLQRVVHIREDTSGERKSAEGMAAGHEEQGVSGAPVRERHTFGVYPSSVR